MPTASLTVLASHKAAITFSSCWKHLAVVFACSCQRRATLESSEASSDIHSRNGGKKQAKKLVLYLWCATAAQERQRQKYERRRVQGQFIFLNVHLLCGKDYHSSFCNDQPALADRRQWLQPSLQWGAYCVCWLDLLSPSQRCRNSHSSRSSLRCV